MTFPATSLLTRAWSGEIKVPDRSTARSIEMRWIFVVSTDTDAGGPAGPPPRPPLPRPPGPAAACPPLWLQPYTVKARSTVIPNQRNKRYPIIQEPQSFSSVSVMGDITRSNEHNSLYAWSGSTVTKLER